MAQLEVNYCTYRCQLQALCHSQLKVMYPQLATGPVSHHWHGFDPSHLRLLCPCDLKTLPKSTTGTVQRLTTVQARHVPLSAAGTIPQPAVATALQLASRPVPVNLRDCIAQSGTGVPQ